MLTVIKQLEPRKRGTENALLFLDLWRPTDGRPYWSGKRGSAKGVKIAGAFVIPDGKGSPFRTDLWIGPEEGLVLGGKQCSVCKRRFRAAFEGECPDCGASAHIHRIWYSLSEERAAAMAREVKERGLKPAEFPLSVVGASKKGEGGGIIAGNIEGGDDPFFGFPDEIRDAVKAVHAMGRDILNASDPRREQRLIIPHGMDIQALTSMSAAAEAPNVEIDL